MSTRKYSGNAVPTTLVTGISNSALTFELASATGWPDGSDGRFTATLDYGTATEEDVDCLSRAGTTVTIAGGGRAYDSTTAVAHLAGGVIRHTYTAVDAQAARDHIDATTAAHAASAIAFTPTGTIAATNVQTALAELGTEDAAVHIADTTAAHVASAVGFTPTTLATGDDVQEAVAQVAHVLEAPLSLYDPRVGCVLNGSDETAKVATAIGLLPSGGGEILIPSTAAGLGIGTGTTGIVVNKEGVVLRGAGAGSLGCGALITWVGSTDAAAKMITVQSQKHGFVLDGVVLDAALKAGIGCHVDVADGAATHRPGFGRVHFKGYRATALILGKNDTVSSGTGQMQIVDGGHLSFQGGLAGATGILQNAQNIEWSHFDILYMDPDPGQEHAYHLFQRAGGVHVGSLLTARSTTYAIKQYTQMVVDAWRAEEALLLDQAAVDIGGPSSFLNVVQREGLAASTDYAFKLYGTGFGTTVDASLYGSLAIGPTDARYVNASCDFPDPAGAPVAGDFIRLATSAHVGMLHNRTTGDVKYYGTAPTLALGTTAKASLNIPHGVAPTSPVNGDVWTTTAGIYVRVNGATVGPLS